MNITAIQDYRIGLYPLPVTTDEQESILTAAITENEPEILRRLLGVDLYNEFIAALDYEPDQKWINLRDGCDFTLVNSSKKIHFNGVKRMLVNRIKFKYLCSISSQTTAQGEVNQLAENTELNRLHDKKILIFNESVRDALTCISFLLSNVDVYTTFEIQDFDENYFESLNNYGI